MSEENIMISSKERKIQERRIKDLKVRTLIKEQTGIQVDDNYWKYLKSIIKRVQQYPEICGISCWSRKKKTFINLPKELVEQFDKL